MQIFFGKTLFLKLLAKNFSYKFLIAENFAKINQLKISHEIEVKKEKIQLVGEDFWWKIRIKMSHFSGKWETMTSAMARKREFFREDF